MKILVLSPYDGPLNTVRPEAELFIAISKLGHSVTIMTQADAPYAKICAEAGIKIIDNYPSKKICLRTIRLVHNELNSGDYDICYAFDSKTIPNAAFGSIGTRAKLVSYRGTTGGLYRHDPSAYLTHLHPKISAIVCNSNAVQRDVKRRVWRKNVRVERIYKGHKVEWYQTEATLRSEFNLKESDIVAICACNVRPSKGISVLLNALNTIQNENFHMLLVGNGYEAHKDEIASCSMKERIHLLGHRKDVPKLMKMADFQIQPSISGEGLPRAVIEAMAGGTPSIVTTTGGGPELIKHASSGLIVKAGSDIEMSEAIQSLINKPDSLSLMGIESTRRINSNFNLNESVTQHIKLFEQLI
ncbi:glycosyltransferase family 4 protein [Vibrio breoganii]|uniref:Glycosyltransferase family 4 protein n=1 Tax=Vibrio breoganii TaxID=553239 RepID=A0ABX1UDW5_9VIBR|nr:glycosyltransferase family 4 protein [Vibrio breoganii]NMO75057.1 glycosyltransferase family 4 protein [Vibrio breoganii]NMR71616.1 glycosyltransferase family 4 protein [Vibrio breoganii]OED99207.1 glycosyl transferase family 1 [Vibrio breoganii ZF-29]OEF81002.1 glycosyl transferase family 1 [Vibrio breoganii 1C10]PML87200.1 glycosyl transferase family 1 [Vibrio breoganii]